MCTYTHNWTRHYNTGCNEKKYKKINTGPLWAERVVVFFIYLFCFIVVVIFLQAFSYFPIRRSSRGIHINMCATRRDVIIIRTSNAVDEYRDLWPLRPARHDFVAYRQCRIRLILLMATVEKKGKCPIIRQNVERSSFRIELTVTFSYCVHWFTRVRNSSGVHAQSCR